MGPGALLSHYSAAELLGLVDVPSNPIHVTIPESRRVLPVRGITIHIARPDAQAAHPTAMPPRTRVEETVLDLAQVAANVDDACAWIARGLERRLTTQQRLSDALAKRPHVHFRTELRELLSDDLAGVHSALAYRYVKWVEMPHSLPRGRRQARAVSAGRRVYRAVLYDEYKLAVELDGRAAHPGDTRWKDIRRDNAAVVDAIMTLRFGSDDLRLRPCLIADHVYRALRRTAPVFARQCSPGCPVTLDS
jgi:hypothetical protein